MVCVRGCMGIAVLALAACGGGGGSPGERLVLFDGSNFEEWKHLDGDAPVRWLLRDDGSMQVVGGSGNIVTRRTFESFFLHIEYKTPSLPPEVSGQARGNSGVYLKRMYEMQVLDSFGRPPEIDGAGSLYGIRAPLVNSCFGQEVWNTYEIDFTAPTYNSSGGKLDSARVTAHLNGQLIHHQTEAHTSTDPANPERPGPAPLMLQDHQNPVSFRNIWLISR